MTLVSSPTLSGALTMANGEIMNNTVDDVIEFLSNDEHTTLQITGFEGKDAILRLYSDQGDDTADRFRIRASDADVLSFDNNAVAMLSFTSAGVASFAAAADVAGDLSVATDKLVVAAATGNVTMKGSITGDGGDAISGFLQKQVAATAVSITAAQCGSTFYNSGAVQMDLPEASTVLGCRLTFVTANASNFDVNPDGGDIILLLTNSAGDAIRNATLGNSVTIQAMSASEWVQISAIGTWTDIN